MMDQIKETLSNSQDTLWVDTVGALSLIVILIGALHLPGMI
jgi:hypothetical protein